MSAGYQTTGWSMPIVDVFLTARFNRVSCTLSTFNLKTIPIEL